MGKVVVEAADFAAPRGVVTGLFVTPSAPLLFGETAWEAVGPTAGLTTPEGDVLSSAALTRKSNPPLSMLFALLLVSVGIRHKVGMHATRSGRQGFMDLNFVAQLTGNLKKLHSDLDFGAMPATLGRCRRKRTKKNGKSEK